MGKYVDFHGSDHNWSVKIQSGFEVSYFYVEHGGYGGVKRIELTMLDKDNGDEHPFVATSFSILERKIDAKIIKILNEKTKLLGVQKAKENTEKANRLNAFLENPLKFLEYQAKKVQLKNYLKKKSFKEQKPIKPFIGEFRDKPIKPQELSYEPKINFFQTILGLKNIKLNKAEIAYKEALINWEREIIKYDNELKKFNNKKVNVLSSFDQELAMFYKKKKLFDLKLEEENKSIIELFELNSLSEERKIESFYKLFMSKISIDDLFFLESDIFIESGTLIINAKLPNAIDFPKTKEVKYVQSKDEFKETFISKSDEIRYYNNLTYSICLFLLKLSYENSNEELISNIAVNGFVEGRNKKDGHFEKKCIITVIADLKTISQIDFKHVSPKECFEGLKGICHSKLIDEIPIKPIIQSSMHDKRFIDSVDNLHTVSSDFNLAAMDWQEFEHLVREIFEKEFTNNGSEVRVTQSSRDGGVDAIAFDPDPIKGGKIVIQAKRYTNVVGVSNVRDLYGTVINEGANRGILITTSDFGADSHNFIKDKPISLINGQNLLYLLEKHGYSAKIDISEAKAILKARETKP